MTDQNAKAVELTAKLSLEQKVALLTGRDFWNTVTIDDIGLRNMLLSDGPAGVRGEFWDERDNSLNLPSGSALGSTWSREIAHEYGVVLGAEAARKGVDVVLGPTINLHRSPLGGRHFECLSEDPMLTGSLAASYTIGLQSTGKGACPKHYVANDFETNRFQANVNVDDRTLNELYLRPFEDAVVDGGAWTIMSSYNGINGATATENELLNNPLRTEWDFDGVVISDWTAVRSLESAKFEQDLEMPGPTEFWSQNLINAVRNGEIAEAVVDRKVVRLLTLALRVGAIGVDGKTPANPVRHNNIAESGRSFARRVASEGSVLLNNDGVLPVDLAKSGKVALIGHNATAARTQGGGSATVHPLTVSTPFDALSDLLGDNLSYSIGAVVQQGIAELPRKEIVNPVTGKKGVRVDFFVDGTEPVYSEDRLSTNLIWLGVVEIPIAQATKLKLTTDFTPAKSAKLLIGYAMAQPVKITINGETHIDTHLPVISDDPFMALMEPPHTSKAYEFEAGKTYRFEVEIDMKGRTGLAAAASSIVFGTEADRSDEDGMIAEAVANAKAAELAIVVVGTNAQVESEGFDRKNLALPGRQDELVEAVVAANPNTIVVVNSGSPVLLPWRDKVRAVLLTYFGGQEMGLALVDMLTGATEPGGRLPTTWAAAEADVPVINCQHDEDLQVYYTEGLHIGYRAWLKAGTKPAYAFGHGLGYTSFELSELVVPISTAAGENFEVSVKVTNTGNRAGKHVVQVYASRSASAIERPAIWLAGFADVRLAAGETRVVSVPVKGREFANWDGTWKYELGQFQLAVGSAVDNLPLTAALEVK
jgi:beta-glucosidase